MKSKHTPGDWIYRRTSTQDGKGGFVRHEIIAGKTRVAEVGGGIYVEANAHLLAVAPELLEALEDVTLALEAHIVELAKTCRVAPSEFCPCLRNEVKRAREVMKRAKGD